MKRLLLFALFSVCLLSVCSASPTTITDVLYQPYNGLPAAGVDVTISQLAFFNAANNYFPAWSVTIHPVTDANGNLSVQLEPNPAGQPYSVILTYPNGVITKEFWNVPVSASPLTISQVITTVGPTPPLGFVQLSQLAQGGAVLLDVIAWNGTQWVATHNTALGLEQTANKDAASGYAGLSAGSLLKTTEFPAFTGDCTSSAGTVALNCTQVRLGGTAHGVVIGEAGSPVAVTAAGTAGQVLTSNGPSADPTFQAAGGAVTDSSYFRYWAGSSAPNLGNFPAPWLTDSSALAISGNGMPFTGFRIAKAGGAHYAYMGVRVPTGWTGAVNLKSFYSLQFSSTGTGTGTHDYALSCQTPGTFDWSGSITWASTVAVNFNITTHSLGATDAPAFSGASLPSCSAGDIMLLRIIRESGGTAADDTNLMYFDISLPHTVQ